MQSTKYTNVILMCWKLCKKILSLFSVIKAFYLHSSRKLYMFSKNTAVNNMRVLYLSWCISSSIPWYCMTCTPQSDSIHSANTHVCSEPILRWSLNNTTWANTPGNAWICHTIVWIFGHCIILSLLLLWDIAEPTPNHMIPCRVGSHSLESSTVSCL